MFSGLSGNVMTGKFGPDTFIFESPFENVAIENFAADIDRIDLSALDADYDSLLIDFAQGETVIDTRRGLIKLDEAVELEAGHFLF